jgi:hypothetical protein
MIYTGGIVLTATCVLITVTGVTCGNDEPEGELMIRAQ